MIAVEVQHYLGRARDFHGGMDLLRSDLDSYSNSSALLGIHGAISYADALRTGMGSKKLSSENHSQAAKELELLLDARRFAQQQGVKHYRSLLAAKSMISYASETVRKNEIEEIVKRAMRFADWAEETGKALKIEGW